LTTSSAAYSATGFEHLRNQIGLQWADLVDQITRLPVSDPHVMAFSLTVRRIQRSLKHQNSPSSHDPLCKVCAHEVASAFQGSEQELIELYYRHLAEIRSTLKTMRQGHQKRAVYAAA
jgi:hypothetical protein